jgi:hypothetical protein
MSHSGLLLLDRKFSLVSLFCHFAWVSFCCFAAFFMFFVDEVARARQEALRLKQELDASFTSLIHFDFAH